MAYGPNFYLLFIVYTQMNLNTEVYQIIINNILFKIAGAPVKSRAQSTFSVNILTEM